ncbi:MAG: hypothetical protein IIX36_04055 [Clostridia bacterium]|nr:hypothetical protein [Clostridia bacterium]
MKIKKLISMILAVIMLCGCFSVCSLAAGKYHYVVLGDSIAYGSGLVNAREACYGKMVADTCGFDYANHAVPGATSLELIYELNKQEVRSDIANADIISISIGGNDFLNELSDLMYQSIVENNYKEFDKIEFGVYANISKVIDTIRELNGGAVILLQTLYNPQFDYLQKSYQYGVDRVNAAVYRCAKENRRVKVVDVAAAINGDEENFADDTLHPSAKGNAIIAQEVLRTLRKLGFTRKTQIEAKVPGVNVVLGPGVSMALNYYAFFLLVLSRAMSAVSMVTK